MKKHGTGKEQKRHWVITIHMNHLLPEKEEYDEHRAENLFEEFLDYVHAGSIAGLSYARGQMEIGDLTNRLHLQCYFEFSENLRELQVIKRLGLNPYSSSAAQRKWIDFRVGTKESVVKYVTKTDSRAGLEFKFGECHVTKVAPENRPKTRALMYIIQEGLTPAEIAILDPECYFTHYAAINALYNMRSRNTTIIETIVRGEEE